MRYSKNGSALLIVLGMLAFMVVSAVAFSGYMRYARLPSSYLRRTASSRQLAKAAVARAIDSIDRAIANNVHPGIGSPNVNTWTHRIYTGNSSLLSPDDTTPILTLESLAYIPPPLVNEARYYSRRSAAAQWQSFGFDAGRYAFCAIDVSDYFDVNRMVADRGRNSSPSRRISMSYLFEPYGHRSAGSGASSWDSFMNQYRSVKDPDTMEFDFKGKIPLVSVADLNLAIGSRKFGSMYSPFCHYVTTGGESGFYGTESLEDEDAIRRMTFVTDSWFPPREETDEEEEEEENGGAAAAREIYDLNDPKYQPFKSEHLETDKIALGVAMGVDNEAVTEGGLRLYRETICGLGRCALFDYLDVDHVPCSLAVPTAERTPMICGLQTRLEGGKLVIEKSQIGSDTGPGGAALVSDGKSRIVERTMVYKIKGSELAAGFMSSEVKPIVCFPFNHEDSSDSGGFTLDGRFALFFSSQEMTLRTGNAEGDLRFYKFQSSTKAGFDNNLGLFSAPIGTMQGVPISFNKKIEEEKQAVKELNLSLKSAAPTIAQQFSSDNNALLTVKYQWTQHRDPEKGITDWEPKEPQNPAEELIYAHTAIPPLKANGTVDNDVKNDSALLATLKGGGGPDLRLNLAMWLRIYDQNQRIVDLVPACIKDDQDLNGDKSYKMYLGPEANKISGSAYPLMRFDTGVAFKMSIGKLEELSKDGGQPIEVTVSPKAVMCADPRFNYAPEHWFATDSAMSVDNWLKECGASGRDGDIFMATSDAGYMQSIYELAFIPRLTDPSSGEGANTIKGLYQNPEDGRKTFGGGFASARNSGLMWRTYNPFNNDQDYFEGMGFTSAGTGFKVNPYSDSTNVLMAALANTPIDWKRATTNMTEKQVDDYSTMNASEFNGKFAWNEYSSGGNFAYEDLEAFAGQFMWKVRNISGNWRRAWRELNWKGNESTFCGISLHDKTDNLWNVDRKFLYGYWRDCFASKQQLFLVIVRAEPMMMGGGMIGQIPPQLGARALALVWRDPRQVKTNSGGDGGTLGYPHQTRILFYRQLE